MAEDNEQKQRNQNQENTNVLFFCKLNKLKFTGFLLAAQKDNFNRFYLHFKPSAFHNDIFRPPQVAIA